MKFADGLMSSDTTTHTAREVDNGWVVSWLPGRVVDRNQAVTAMLLVESVAEGGVLGWRRAVADIWAAELDLTLGEALALASAGGES